MSSQRDRGLARGLTNYGDADFSLYLRRSFASSMGYSREILDRPVVGICHAAGGFNNCYRDVPEMIEAVKRGVLSARALPLEFPTISLGEVFLVPTSLKFRNLMSMDVEEMIRASPGGAIIKRSAADPRLFERDGRCIVFSSLDDLASRIDDPDLDVTPDDFLVLKNAGPKSAAAMPEAGYLPIPKKLARRGVKDMVRISDARMSGTAFGTVVLHVTPDAGSGGPLALIRTGDRIRLSVRERRLDLLVEEDELDRRRSALAIDTNSAAPLRTRGYSWLYDTFITQANEGCDFAFLKKNGIVE